MSKSQQRKAVKNAVATLARTQSDVSTNARETAPAATEARQAATQETVRPAMQVEQQRPAAQQAYDIRRVRDAAASLGENGAKALSASYDGSVQADDYYAGFASYYEAGISGIDMDKVQSRYAAQLNQAQRFAASPPVRTTRRPPSLEREGRQERHGVRRRGGLRAVRTFRQPAQGDRALYDSLACAAGVKIQMAEATRQGRRKRMVQQRHHSYCQRRREPRHRGGKSTRSPTGCRRWPRRHTGSTATMPCPR